MRVGVERDRDRCVSKTFRYDLWVDTGGEGGDCVGVAQIVEANSGEPSPLRDHFESISEGLRVYP
jgi:hypothetical protein